MMTNSFTPMVGGIEQSIQSFTDRFEKLGHQVIIVAPEAEGAPPDEEGVVRIRAIQNFNHSNFSMALPMSGLLPELMKQYQPDIVHSHHPFWMGDIALRLCRQNHIPLVFTYHTMFEHHMHYLPVQNEGMRRFVIELTAGYANLADQVIAPSQSVQDLLVERGVLSPITVVPTGIDLKKFANGQGSVIRKRWGIPLNSKVVGFVGRLAIEKNLEFLSQCTTEYLKKNPSAYVMLVGNGPLEEDIKKIFHEAGVGERMRLLGPLQGQDLVDAYHAMDVFAFASLSETQGIVLLEAMAASVPVVALDATGVREVVKDQDNGRLIFHQDQGDFVEALQGCVNQPYEEYLRMKQQARISVQEFSIEVCAPKMLRVYEEVLKKEIILSEEKDTAWHALANRLKVEWEMFKNMMKATGMAMSDATTVAQKPVLKSGNTASCPGLVMIQIDGFSQTQLKIALTDNKMPFLKNLLARQQYELYPLYTGLPSNTAAVQGELFYGKKQSVPAFSFRDQDTQKVFTMYDGDAASEIERRLALTGPGLLDGGSSYSNIFTGGAKEAHFCAALLGWNKIWKDFNLWSLAVLITTHLFAFGRMIVLMGWEIILGTIDYGWRLFAEKNFKNEIKFIYLRALISVMLRELVILGVKMDLARGMPIIHFNLLGYDEHSHNRGPSSRSARWTLPGIDRAIQNIYNTAMHSSLRRYDVWIYSDHGQEEADSYHIKYGRSVETAVVEILKEFYSSEFVVHPSAATGSQLTRVRFLGKTNTPKLDTSLPYDTEQAAKLVVTAIGPTGNIYLPAQMSRDDEVRLARKLVEQAKIPVVMRPEEDGQVRVWREDGEFILPQDAKKIFGEDHPYLAAVTADLIQLCQHPNAGNFTFMGFRPGQKNLTFPSESGSHAGPGWEETNAFALLPSDVVHLSENQPYVVTMDLRTAALQFLERESDCAKTLIGNVIPYKQNEGINKSIRIMTFNVHGCIGTDGKISPERIARVIARLKPDIVALQELDMKRARTGGVDQPHIIAQQLEMMVHFHPSFQIEEERYGNAILSRYPMELVRAGALPGTGKYSWAEPRGALWTAINIGDMRLQFLNTHLSVLPWERTHQVEAILGSEWLGHPACTGPVVLCGDLNSLPNSAFCRDIKVVLNDAQTELEHHRPRSTWFSHYPIGRIDHVFVSEDLEVTHVAVARTDLGKLASDHLPLIVDVRKKSI
ncbi:MAG: glycosyltransferase [Candidatus Omnitrophica bacterium]|nr:glycosyltransferase [Candidatus Omnitrophota bacterium]